MHDACWGWCLHAFHAPGLTPWLYIFLSGFKHPGRFWIFHLFCQICLIACLDWLLFLSCEMFLFTAGRRLWLTSEETAVVLSILCQSFWCRSYQLLRQHAHYPFVSVFCVVVVCISQKNMKKVCIKKKNMLDATIFKVIGNRKEQLRYYKPFSSKLSY